MANEAQIAVSATVRILQNGLVDQQWQPQPTSFSADVSQAGGPSPGGFLASTTGTQVVLSSLTQPGFCRIQNLGVNSSGASLWGTPGQQYYWQNYVEVGLYVPSLGKFIPLMELLPGESYVIRLSRYIGSEFGGSEPGTSPEGGGIQLMVKAIGTASKVVVEAIER